VAFEGRFSHWKALEKDIEITMQLMTVSLSFAKDCSRPFTMLTRDENLIRFAVLKHGRVF